MNFAEKLKTLRKQLKFSQEQLAEKINVSRQAITKWETRGGLLDIENLMAIATPFSVSMDELLSDEKLTRALLDYAYENVMEYDISRPSHLKFITKVEGKSNRVRYKVDGKPAEVPTYTNTDSRIEVADMNVELLIEQGARNGHI